MSQNKKGGLIILLVIFFVGIIVLMNALVITKENEFSIIKRFNKIERVISQAGLTVKAPFVDTVDKLPKQIQFYDMKKSDVITKDKKTMVADNYVLWKIVEPRKFAQTLNSSITVAEGRIDTTVYNTMKNEIGRMEQHDVISGRDGELSQMIMANIGNNLKESGIELLSVEVKHLDLPSDNKSAVFERMISERSQTAATYIAEGESEAQKKRNETDKKIAISISDAKTEAAKIIAEGEAEYMRILSSSYSNKERSEFYTFVRALEAARASLKGNNKTIILSNDSPIAQIFNSID